MTLLLSKKTRCSVNLDTPVLKVRDKWRSLSCYQQSLTILAQIHLCLPTVKKNCAELYKSGKSTSGVYAIDPDGSGAFDVYCDQTTDGGGWTVFQRRLTGSVDFNRSWADYKHGFGSFLDGEFWLGLDKILRLTKKNKNNRLRVDLGVDSKTIVYAEYKWFGIANETAEYQLNIGNLASKSIKATINDK